MRTIDADVLLETVRKETNGIPDLQMKAASIWFVHLIENQPTVENKGTWIESVHFGDALGGGKHINSYAFECSKCKHTVTDKTDFCSKCGADLRG